MKLVSSSYFKKAEGALTNALPFVQENTRIIETLLHNKTVKEFTLIRGGKGNKHILILISGNRGLCGGFNVNAGRLANEEVHKLKAEGKEVQIICFGEKALSGLKPETKNLIVSHIKPAEKDPWVYASTIINHLTQQVFSAEIDSCSIVYTAFQSMLVSTTKTQGLVPYTGCLLENNKNFRKSSTKLPELLFSTEPNYATLIRKSAENHLKSQLYFAMLESRASEESARMIAMDGATKSSEEMLEKLYITYNRNRQATITRELIEIIAGAESI